MADTSTTAQKIAAEVIGTFILVFFGCGTAIVDRGRLRRDHRPRVRAHRARRRLRLRPDLRRPLQPGGLGRRRARRPDGLAPGAGRTSAPSSPARSSARPGAVHPGPGLRRLRRRRSTDWRRTASATSGIGYAVVGGVPVEIVLTAIFVCVILAVTDDAQRAPGARAAGDRPDPGHDPLRRRSPLTGTSVNPARSIGVGALRRQRRDHPALAVHRRPAASAPPSPASPTRCSSATAPTPVAGSGCASAGPTAAVPGYGAPDQYQQEWNQQAAAPATSAGLGAGADHPGRLAVGPRGSGVEAARAVAASRRRRPTQQAGRRDRRRRHRAGTRQAAGGRAPASPSAERPGSRRDQLCSSSVRRWSARDQADARVRTIRCDRPARAAAVSMLQQVVEVVGTEADVVDRSRPSPGPRRRPRRTPAGSRRRPAGRPASPARPGRRRRRPATRPRGRTTRRCRPGPGRSSRSTSATPPSASAPGLDRRWSPTPATSRVASLDGDGRASPASSPWRRRSVQVLPGLAAAATGCRCAPTKSSGSGDGVGISSSSTPERRARLGRSAAAGQRRTTQQRSDRAATHPRIAASDPSHRARTACRC